MSPAPRVYADNYEAHLSLGMTPIPIKPGTKRPPPGIGDLSPLSNSLPSREQVETWLSGYADHGIGLVMGTPVPRADGLRLVGVDVDDPTLVEAVRQALLRPAPTKRGKPDRATMFAHAPLALARTRHWKRIEILGIGQQTVIPPTPHPETGKPYFWDGPDLVRWPYPMPLLDEWVLAELEAWEKGDATYFQMLNGMEWRGVNGGGNTHNACHPAAMSLAAKGWTFEAVYRRIMAAKAEACRRAGEELDWPDADRVIREWSESGLEKSTASRAFQFSDLGNSERLYDRHGENIHHATPFGSTSGRFYVYRDGIWLEDKGEYLIEGFARETVRSIYREASEIIGPDGNPRKSTGQHAIRSEGRGRIRAMIDGVRSMGAVPIEVDQFDFNPSLLAHGGQALDLSIQKEGDDGGDSASTDQA